MSSLLALKPGGYLGLGDSGNPNCQIVEARSGGFGGVAACLLRLFDACLGQDQALLPHSCE